jgi:RimJ/RimL family protein N-acetyltransferase
MCVQVRSLVRDDFSTLISWFPDEMALVQWGGPDVRFPLDEAQLDRMLDEGRSDPPARRLWAGEIDGALAAHAQMSFDRRHGVARLARVSVDPARRRHGLATPFLSCVIRQAFDEPVIMRIELNVFTFNQAAIRTYMKLGFVQEGVRRSTVQVGDQRWDAAMFGLLRSDWLTAG